MYGVPPLFYLSDPDFIDIFHQHFSVEKFSKFSQLLNSICAVYNFKNFKNRTKIEHEN